jgi:hypothetical protein
VVKKYLAKHNVMALEHSSYSPDLSLPRFFLFLNLKSVLKGHQYASIEVASAEVMRSLIEVLEKKFQGMLPKAL